MLKKSLKIGDKIVGENHPVFIIAEAGANFNISKDKGANFRHALKMIDIAAEAKADAVKFQLYKAEKLYVRDAGHADYIGKKKPIFDIIKDMELPYGWIPKLKEHCDKKGIIFLCSPFDEDSAEELENAGIEAYKIASYSISHIPLIKHLAKKGKPLLFSTGASDMKDIRGAIAAAEEEGNNSIAVLQCTAKYPAPLSTINLNAIPKMKQELNAIVGLSDHSREPYVAPLGAIALGAKMIEKHYTTDNSLPGPDHGFAVLPDELKEMVAKIKQLEEALGDSKKYVLNEEKELYDFAREFIYAKSSISKGDIISRTNTSILRPGKFKRGLEASRFYDIEGKAASRDIKKGDPITESSVG